MPAVGEAVLVLEKLLYGLIVFLVSSCLERLTHLFVRDGPCPALPKWKFICCQKCVRCFSTLPILPVYITASAGEWAPDLPKGPF